jgi:hypothetical protein
MSLAFQSPQTEARWHRGQEIWCKAPTNSGKTHLVGSIDWTFTSFQTEKYSHVTEELSIKSAHESAESGPLTLD